MTETKFEPMGYLSVIATSAERAREFFGMPDARVEDAGPVPEDRRARYLPEARVWHVFPSRA